MRNLFTLFLLCVLCFTAQGQWRSEIYLLGGLGKSYVAETRLPSGNLGISASTGGEVFYFNAGASLYYLRGEGGYLGYFPSYNINSENYVTEVAVGGGVMGQLGIATLRIGPDVGVNIGLSTRGTSYSIIPKAMLTFDLGDADLGIMAKASFSLLSEAYFSPGFYGGGIILSF